MNRKHPINILHITFDMGLGGTEQVIRNLIKGSDSDRFKHHLCCIESPLGPWGRELKDMGIPVFVFQRKPKLDLGLISKIRALIKQHNINVVHTHQYTPFTYGFFAAIGLSAKVIFTEHGRFYPDSSTFKRRMINRLLFPFVDVVTAISEATKFALVQYECIQDTKIQVIYNGIHAVPTPKDSELKTLRQELGLKPEHLIFGTIARFDPIKNQALMIRAFAELNKKHPHTRLILVGDGSERPNLEALVAELALNDSVIFTGYRTNPYEFIHLFDVFLLTSLSEGTSMTLLEAMSAGKPCIASDAGGNPEIVTDQKTGLIFPSKDEIALVNALLQLTENESLRSQFGAEALSQFNHRFSSKKMQKTFGDIYTKLCK